MSEHIFFDLDRTLWDFDKNSSRVLDEMFDEHLAWQGLADKAVFIAKYQEINEHAWHEYRSGIIEKDLLRWIRFYRTMEHFGRADKQLSVLLGEQYVERSPYQKGLLPNAFETLEYLKEKGYHMHILTNGFSEIQHIKMQESGLTPYFKNLITSESLGVQKPHAQAFDAAREIAGIANQHAIMIGDDLHVDVLGAQAVGMTGVYFNITGALHNEAPNHEISNLIELCDLL
jgi:putative hydrolase of the HAD superfamily